MIPLAYNLRSVGVRKATSAAAAVGLGLVVFVLAAALMLQHSVQETTRRALAPNTAIVLRSGASSEIESGIEVAQLGRILSAPGVARDPFGKPRAVAELIALVVLDAASGGGVANVQLRGVPDDVLSFRPTSRISEGRAPHPGSDEAIVGRAIRGRFRGLELGEQLALQPGRPLRIVGVLSDDRSAYESEIWAATSFVQQAFGQPSTVSSVRVQLTADGAFEAFQAAVERDRQLGVRAYREAEFALRQTQGTATFLAAIGFMVSSLFAIAAMLGALITMHAAVAERRREIGTLRALGFSRWQVLGSFLVESIVLALAGGGLGLAASLLLALQRISMVNTATWGELSFGFEPDPAIACIAISSAATLGLIGGLSPALRAMRVDPAQAMRGG